MINYLTNILPRIRQHSQALDRKELFTDQPWVIIDGELNKQQLIFKRDGRLLMSNNGLGFEGRWEYLPEVNGLWIDRGFDKLLLNQGFFLQGVMILKRDGLNDEPLIFANPNKVPNLDVRSYLEGLITVQSENSQPSAIPLRNNEFPYNTDRGMIRIKQNSAAISKADYVTMKNDPYPDGQFFIQNHQYIDYIKVYAGQVIRIKYINEKDDSEGSSGYIWAALIILIILALIVWFI